MAEKVFPDRGDGQNVVLPKKGLIFLCVGKCASSAIKRVAQSVDKKSYKVTKEQVVSCHNLQGFRRVAVVRNPYTRLASIWRDKTQRGQLYRGFRGIPGMAPKMNFEKFVRVVHRITDYHPLLDGHFRSQSDLLMTREGLLIPDIIIPFEELKAGWADLAGHYGLPNPLPAENSRKGFDYFSLYEADGKRELRGLCETRYLLDFINFYPDCLNKSTASDPRGFDCLRKPFSLSREHRETTWVLPGAYVPDGATGGASLEGVIMEAPAVSSKFDEFDGEMLPDEPFPG